MAEKPTKTDAVVRDPKGRVTKGAASLNPGGLTAVEREARDAIRSALATTGMRKLGLAAYRRLLKAANPLITKDFMDRLAGKPKDRVQIEDGEGNAVNPFRGVGLDQILEAIRSGK